MPGHKVCNKCKELKSFNDFSKRGKKSRLLQSSCKICVATRVRKNYKEYYHKRVKDLYKENPAKYRERHLKTKYGLTSDQYDDLLRLQNGVCAVCSQAEIRINKRTGTTHLLSIDHCHKTNKIRGLLCDACNRAEGFLRGDIEVMKRLIEYIQKHRE